MPFVIRCMLLLNVRKSRTPPVPANTKHLYNADLTSSTLVQHFTNVIFVYWSSRPTWCLNLFTTRYYNSNYPLSNWSVSKYLSVKTGIANAIYSIKWKTNSSINLWKIYISHIKKSVSATLLRGKYTLAYPRGRYIAYGPKMREAIIFPAGYRRLSHTKEKILENKSVVQFIPPKHVRTFHYID